LKNVGIFLCITDDEQSTRWMILGVLY